MTAPVPWRVAWQEALYGPSGFYRSSGGPARHFATATHGGTGRALAAALWGWADRLGVEGIVDVGAGRGELLQHLYAAAPDRRLAGLDVVERPAGLPATVGWSVAPGGAELRAGWTAGDDLVVAHEWLDVVPCTVGEVDADGRVREVLVDPAKSVKSLGSALSAADLQWCQRFWPSVVSPGAEPGDRVEVGRQRDEAWAALLDRMGKGVALAVDYGHTAESRPPAGTLAGYREGRLVAPVPDGSCDVTAHVAVDSLAQTRRMRQRDALPGGGPPDPVVAERDPAAYLRQLAAHSEVAALRRPSGFGDFWWVFAEP